MIFCLKRNRFKVKTGDNAALASGRFLLEYAMYAMALGVSRGLICVFGNSRYYLCGFVY